MTIQNSVTKTTQSATITFNGRPAVNSYASIESDGSYTLNFNVTDATTYFESEADVAKDMLTILTNVRKAAKTQRTAYLANQTVPDEPDDNTATE